MLGKNYVRAIELAKILDISKSSMYFLIHPEQKKKVAIKKALKEKRKLGKKNFVMLSKKRNNINFIRDNGNVLIEIDDFLNNHKIYNFKFINELSNESFLKRIEVTKVKSLDDYDDYISTSQFRDITGFTNYQIKKLRESGEIQYKQIIDERYPVNATGRTQYLYDKRSIIEYIKSKNIDIKTEKEIVYEFTKQFYSANEIQDYLYCKYEKNVSKLTIYRRITQSNEIPGIRIGSMIKVPILEFNQLQLKEIFKIDT